MKDNISLDQARILLKKYVHTVYLLKHSRETEVIMAALARHFGENEELWAVTGLLHDLDMDETQNQLERHGARTCEMLEQEGYDIPEMFHAIKAHCENLGHLGVKREAKMDFCLSAAENLTGIIVAYVLMRPDKKIAQAEASSITKKLKDKSFAANVNRDLINDIEKADLQRNEFITMALNAMKSISQELGL